MRSSAGGQRGPEVARGRAELGRPGEAARAGRALWPPIVRQAVERRGELAEERLEQTKRVLAYVAPVQALSAESEKTN
jgi:hypothetical protein